MLKWDEISLQNKKLATYNLLLLLEEAYVVQTLSIEQIEEILFKVIPSNCQKENQFYNDKKVKKIYADLRAGKNEVNHEGDPCCNFYEFQLILGRISLEMVPKDNKEL